MNEIEIVKAIMKANKVTGAALAQKMGYNTPSAVTNRLQSRTMTVEVLVNLLESMGYKLVIQHEFDKKDQFIVDNENRNEVKSYNTSKKKDGEQ